MSTGELEALLHLSAADRIGPIAEKAQQFLTDGAADSTQRAALIDALVNLIASGEGSVTARVVAGEVLGHLGDPRLCGPEDDAYWSSVTVDEYQIEVGRHLVTVAEINEFLSGDGYKNDAYWSDRGRQWRDTRRTLWTDLATEPDSIALIIPNQPAVGVTWHEAWAYAVASGARLLTLDERLQIMRGMDNRPYPWGQPFGYGNANTREEAVGKPVAVGLFRADCTSDGVMDLAGNVAEWTADEADDECVIHPGSWNSPSMSAWAKARALVPAKVRSADLGFRIARDV